MWDSLRRHWPEYAIEAAGIAVFVLVAVAFACALEHPASPLHRAVPDADPRRAPFALGVGLATVALVYSPWGQRSGAPFNPAVTLILRVRCTGPTASAARHTRAAARAATPISRSSSNASPGWASSTGRPLRRRHGKPGWTASVPGTMRVQ